MIDVTLAEEYGFPELVVTLLFVVTDIEVGVEESLSDNCQFCNSYYISVPVCLFVPQISSPPLGSHVPVAMFLIFKGVWPGHKAV